MTSRRAILVGMAALGGAVRAGAQQRTHRLAMLMPGADIAGSGMRAFFGRLEEVGYRERHNLVVDRRFAQGRLELLPALAAELVALKPDVLLAGGTQAALAASKATTAIPSCLRP